MARWFAWYSARIVVPERLDLRVERRGGADHLVEGATRCFPARELRAFSASWRSGSGSASISWYQALLGRPGGAPRRRGGSRFQSARRTPLLLSNARYTVLSATPASAAIAAIVVAA